MNAIDPNRVFSIEGETLSYPTEFRDGSSAAAIFTVDGDIADTLIAKSGFRTARVTPSRALMVFTAVNYEDTDCGTYHETAFAFFVQRPDEPDRGCLRTIRDIVTGNASSFTWMLQVDTKLSQRAGIEMWGFPKTIADIRCSRRNDTAEFALDMDGRRLIDFQCPARGGLAPAPVGSRVYSILDGEMQLSTLTQSYRGTGYHLRGAALEAGDHPLADTLKELGAVGKPLVAIWNEHLHFSMTAPRPVCTRTRRAA